MFRFKLPYSCLPLLLCCFKAPAQTPEMINSWEHRVDSLLNQAPSVDYILGIINMVVWDSKLFNDLPSIYPVRIEGTRIEESISSRFGYRTHPIFGNRHLHSGIDIPGAQGDSIYVTGNGIVNEIGFDDKLGGFIRVSHKYNLTTVYGHMRKALCVAGDTVTIGKPIGLMGNTGNSTGAHLHYTVKFGNSFADPLPFCYLMLDYLGRKREHIKQVTDTLP